MLLISKLFRLKSIQFRIIRNLPASAYEASNLRLLSHESQLITRFKGRYISPTLWVSEETLESLSEFFEELVEERKEFEFADVSYSSGILTVNLGKYGTYVINRQSPNKQIWLSSPTSGPKRYDYVVHGSYWIYKHDNKSIHQLLGNELSNILGKNINLSKCLHCRH